ncbi:hypothetical protein QVD17_36068 [Tagetes erecta]|uniref:Transcription factor CBF/NF-Y/archaeal histone domain-containing protein n=1 Tax=Tagetes erecta TaxID=13708 RepID=A0AAD8JVL2_TARER|nr:hypothetical protein QVD17_36068 [Tagetes erecta]
MPRHERVAHPLFPLDNEVLMGNERWRYTEPKPLTIQSIISFKAAFYISNLKQIQIQIQSNFQFQYLFSSVRSDLNATRSFPAKYKSYFTHSPGFPSVIMADVPGSPAGGSHESGGEQSPHSNSNIREQDRFLPIANISRIMKKALPANGKIAKDAKDTVQECVSEFISFVTSEASDKCLKEKRKTINGDDLLWAMATLGFEDYIEPLKAYLSRYRELEGDSKGSARGDGSGKKDTVGSQIVPNAQYAHQGSYTQGMNYLNSHV